MMQIRLIVCVRSVHVASTSPPPDREGAPAGAGDGDARLAAVHPSGDAGRAARVYAPASSGGARRQPLDLRSALLAVGRDGRDAVGHEADPRRRARAAARRATPAGTRAATPGCSWAAGSRPARRRRPDPRRARRGGELREERERPQRRRNTDRARRRAVVAFDRPRRPAAQFLGRASATVFVMSESLQVTIVYEQGEEGWVVASIPEVPGAHSQGRTREEARANVIDALRGILELRFGGRPGVKEGADSEPLELVIGG